MLFQIPLPHTAIVADVLGRLRRKDEIGEVIVSVFGVGYFHMKSLLFCDTLSITDTGGIVECAEIRLKLR